MGTSREALSNGIPLARARLQMQIGHARATKRTFTFFSDSRGQATGLGRSRETLTKNIPWAQARLQMQIGHARATGRTFTFFQIVEWVLPACVHPKRFGGKRFHRHRHDFTCRLGMLGRREKQSLLQIVEGELPAWLHPEIL